MHSSSSSWASHIYKERRKGEVSILASKAPKKPVHDFLDLLQAHWYNDEKAIS